MTAAACAEIADLDAIVPVQQGQIGRELGRQQVKEGNPPCAACRTHCACAFVVEIVKGGRGIAEQIVFFMAGKNLDGIDLEFGAFECGVMFEDQKVGRREPLERLGLADQDAVAEAKGDGLERLERKRDAWTGRVIRSNRRATAIASKPTSLCPGGSSCCNSTCSFSASAGGTMFHGRRISMFLGIDISGNIIPR